MKAKVALAVVLALSVFAVAPAYAGLKHAIRGSHDDMPAVCRLLDESLTACEVRLSGRNVRELIGLFRLDRKLPAEEAVINFLAAHSAALGLNDPACELKLVKTEAESDGGCSMRFQQVCHGIAVSGKELSVTLNAGGELYYLGSVLSLVPQADTDPMISPAAARDVVKNEDAAEMEHFNCDLVLHNCCLAYELSFYRSGRSWKYIVDAKSGIIIEREDRS